VVQEDDDRGTSPDGELPRRSVQDHLEPQLRVPGGAGGGTPFEAFAPEGDAPAELPAPTGEAPRAAGFWAGVRRGRHRRREANRNGTDRRDTGRHSTD
jgi:hypothetical protein